MAKSRNERRKLAKARLAAKTERIARAELGRIRDEQRAIVAHNLASPRERVYPIRSCLSSFEDRMHRASCGALVARRRSHP